MIKKYIKGNNERGLEVIKELEKLGGYNTEEQFSGKDETRCYFINDKNKIDYCNINNSFHWLLINCFEEIILEEPFIRKQYIIYTEKKIKGCNGCVFDYLGDCLKQFILEDCEKENIIYKLKK